MEHNTTPSGSKARRLLPAPLNDGGVSSNSTVSLYSRNITVPPKRSTITAACVACRARKVKCSAERPRCARCAFQGTDCVYDTARSGETHSQALKRKYAELSERNTTYEQIYEMLQARSDIEAREIFNRIRGGADAESVLRHIQEGDILLQLALSPETRYRYEFPFIKEMPAFLQQGDNPYLDSLVYEWTRKDFSSSKASTSSLAAESAGAAEYKNVYLKPYHTADIVDPRLETTKPSNWTTVSTNDGLMRKLLAAYFMYGYQWFTFFQKDYFLEDMAADRHRFCSSLLVNAVLACAYSCDPRIPKRYEYWNPQSLGYQFLAEAKRLWALDAGKNRLTTIHAGLVITLIHNMTCMDKIGWTYTLQAVTMAYNLRLFDPAAKAKGRKRRNARDFTAWALFSYQCLHCYVMFDEPVIRKPPDIPLPDPSVDPEWYGQIWVKYPTSPKPFSTHFGHVFKASAEIRVIMNDICLRCFGKQASSPRVALEQILGFHTRLKDWYDNLPAALLPKLIVSPSQLMLHMSYQTVLINLYEPFRADDSVEQEHITGEIADNASIHLETLIRLYYLRHSFARFDPFLVHPLNVLGFSSINKIKANMNSLNLDAIRSTLVLAAKGIYDQGQSHYIGHVTLRFLKEGMRPEEKGLLCQIADLKDAEDEVTKSKMSEVQARWAPSIISVADNPEAQRLSSLVKQYMDMTLDSESDRTSGDSPSAT